MVKQTNKMHVSLNIFFVGLNIFYYAIAINKNVISAIFFVDAERPKSCILKNLDKKKLCAQNVCTKIYGNI